MKIYSSKAIANEFISLAKYENKQLTQMHIHKLIYFAHAISLVLHKQALVQEEFRAWPFGPVLVDLYREFKDFGKNPIDRYAKGSKGMVEPSDSETLEIIKKVWEEFKEYEGWQLSQFTHVNNSPWKNNFEEGQSNTIPNEEIYEFYKDKVSIDE
ncbi:Panacea domain-containing protein [Helicobacter cetorum]|uniref:Genetic Element protein A n=1 Tax=Helicobacter cetorum (strain ATCC BAA-540 / CCUG 52418 / MIT 99-5656) TaxID=1163745 RepID=I0EQE5_HELCM|nr:type II toxin-antitoxin system antitoxin SocA domain-containing protein [Helicobacter cetorum]AFI05164.1 Genetic Element protein A [Helicobacter cetorum MIT 99-5656]